MDLNFFFAITYKGARVSAHKRIRRQYLVRQAEGYLELGMAQHALEVLARCCENDELNDHALYLRGEALKSLGRFQEAIEPLAQSARGMPENIHVWLSLGWCHKRIGRLDLAIEDLEEALAVEPQEALIHYNLACYWSLAENKRKALGYLARAFELDENFRMKVHEESDFDFIRNDATFQALISVIV